MNLKLGDELEYLTSGVVWSVYALDERFARLAVRETVDGRPIVQSTIAVLLPVEETHWKKVAKSVPCPTCDRGNDEEAAKCWWCEGRLR